MASASLLDVGGEVSQQDGCGGTAISICAEHSREPSLRSRLSLSASAYSNWLVDLLG